MFFDNFERICKERGISPSAAAMSIGKSRNTASNWKANGTIPKAQELEDLAFELKCDVADFFIDDPMEHLLLKESEFARADDVPYLAREHGLHIDDNVHDFIRIYNACTTVRQRHKLMDAVYDFEDKVLNAEEETC